MSMSIPKKNKNKLVLQLVLFMPYSLMSTPY
jgi:hypothetical protein